MGGLCGSTKPQKHKQSEIPIRDSMNQNRFNNQYNNNNNQNGNIALFKKVSIDPRLYNEGQKYLIRQSKTDQYQGKVPGGKMPIKLLFSLDKNQINPSYNPSQLSFKISFSEVMNPKNFKGENLIDGLNKTNMTFSSQIITEYFFEFDQQIKISMYYQNNQFSEALISSANLNGNPKHTLEVPISLNNNNNQDFKLIIVSDPIKEELSRVAVSFEMRMEVNDNFRYFAVFENTFNNNIQSIFKTAEETGPYPKIMAIDIAFGDLSFDGTNDQDFDIVFYKKNNNNIDRLGKVTYSLKTVDNMSHDILSENGQIYGKVSISSSKRNVKRFVDYIYSGLQIGMVCAIDFTASNLDINDEKSLHYIKSPEPNQYEQSIRASAGIIAYYDSDKLFPCYGFGADYNGQTSHCFNLTLSQNSEVDGVENILKTYKNCIHQIELSGPTFFSPVIYKTIQDIKTKGTENNYYILLIITDGQITDEEPTRKAIVEASVLPLSIIIVGVGSANFASMNRLDGDENPLRDASGRRVRDIVQFVHYNQRYALNHAAFSQDLLYEIPSQVEGYFRSIGK